MNNKERERSSKSSESMDIKNEKDSLEIPEGDLLSRREQKQLNIYIPERDSSLTISRSRGCQESHYSKEIESNLLRFTALKGSESQTNVATKVLHNETPDMSIFNTLSRMKSKF